MKIDEKREPIRPRILLGRNLGPRKIFETSGGMLTATLSKVVQWKSNWGVILLSGVFHHDENRRGEKNRDLARFERPNDLPAFFSRMGPV